MLGIKRQAELKAYTYGLCESGLPQGSAYYHLVGMRPHIPLFVGLLEFAHNAVYSPHTL